MGRVEGFVGRQFTGQYTDSQRSEIRSMFNNMESDVIVPTREKIGAHYSNLAKSSGVPQTLVETPNFYGSTPSNPQAEADAFLKGMSGGKSK